MQEIWTDIAGFEGKYQISSFGNVRNAETLKPVKSYTSSNGYKQVNLVANSTKKLLLVHRLVAIAFVPNPYGLPQVNHIDENKFNNVFLNLEWCDATYNNNYGTHNSRVSAKMKIPIMCVESGKHYACISDAAAELNVSIPALSAAISNGHRCKGFHFIKCK